MPLLGSFGGGSSRAFGGIGGKASPKAYEAVFDQGFTATGNNAGTTVDVSAFQSSYVYLFGAGGGGAGYAGPTASNGVGGNGAYMHGVLDLSNHNSITIKVGLGGPAGDNVGAQVTQNSGDTNAGSGSAGNGTSTYDGGAGGGMSYIYSNTNTEYLAIAGGGGGCGGTDQFANSNSHSGGDGGAPNGVAGNQAINHTSAGQGGNQNAGGSGGVGSGGGNGNAGSLYTGGNAGVANSGNSGGSGGGGGGYYGGGGSGSGVGGADQYGSGGGGGSSLVPSGWTVGATSNALSLTNFNSANIGVGGTSVSSGAAEHGKDGAAFFQASA